VQAPPRGGVTDVEHDALESRCRDGVRGRPTVDRFGQIEGRHMPAVGQQRLGDRPAQPAGRPGDDRSPRAGCGGEIFGAAAGHGLPGGVGRAKTAGGATGDERG
jgi:hypothetical protein